MGYFTAILMITTLILTFVGGALSSIDWRMAFLVVPAICAISFIKCRCCCQKIFPPKMPSKDVPGQVLLALGIIAFIGGVGELSKSRRAPSHLVELALASRC